MRFSTREMGTCSMGMSSVFHGQAVGQGEQPEASGAREPQEVFGEAAWPTWEKSMNEAQDVQRNQPLEDMFFFYMFKEVHLP